MWSMASLPGSVTTALVYGANHSPAVTPSPVGPEGDVDPAFRDQDFLAGVLAVTVRVCPVVPVMAVVAWQV